MLWLLLACGPTTPKVGETGTVDGVPLEEGPAFVLNPQSLDFGTVFVGKTALQEVDVLNNGSVGLQLGLSIEGALSAAYTLSISPEGILNPGEHASLSVNLVPTEWGNGAVTVAVADGATRRELSVLALVEEDADGDGVGSRTSGGTDCDDTNAEVFPGTAETWYDGLDSDCAGDDDFDQDKDGHDALSYGGDDCMDTDAAVYPGATDYWYDGVDTDCGGNSDYDQDGDGHDATAYGGDDCEDHDPSIYGGAPETWYDGVDQDCAGDDDYDQDHDGYTSGAHGGPDCDDVNAAIHPGATEIWYDGVDQDCAGDDDYDQDKDKVDSSLYGGTDCNDLDATVTGPTAEARDGQDNDCNGYVDDFTVTSVSGGSLFGTGTNQYLGMQGAISVGGDLTGDGIEDLVVGTAYTSYGKEWVVSGGTWKGANGKVSSYDYAEFSNDNQYISAGWVQGPATDVDGDGTADLLVTAYSASYGYGTTYLFTSLSATFGTSAAAASYTGDSTNDYTRVAMAGDLDGDGLSEVVTGNAWDAYYTSNAYVQYAGLLAVFDAYAGSYTIGDAVDYINGENNYDYLGYSLTVQDMDGDGYADLLAGAPGHDGAGRDYGAIYLVNGNAALTWNGDQIQDAKSWQVEGTTQSGQLGLDPLYQQGDLDGDGANDLVVSSKAVGSVWLWWGLPTADTTVASASASFSGTAASFGAAVAISDLDGDGADDLAVGDPGSDLKSTDAGAVWIYSNHSAWSGAVSRADAVLWGAATGDGLGAGLAGGVDVEKNGSADLAVGATGADGGGSNSGAVYFVSGW